MTDPKALIADAELENRIDIATLLLHTSHSADERRAAWEMLQMLVSKRSTQRVAQMEAERGLAR